MLKKIIRIASILIIGIILGGLFLILSYLLPSNVIEKNIAKSIEIFEKEEKYESDIYGYRNTKLDNFTDAIMLQNASYTGNESLIDKAMNVYRYNNDDDPGKSLINQINNKNNEKIDYSRYWHGYLIILKPLLLLFSYNDIRFINTIIQPLLVLSIVYLMIKKKKENYIIPYVISILMISPNTIAKSMQYSTIFYLFNLAMLFMLLYNDKLKNKYPYFFLIMGMLTSYFDFLTYPLATLGMTLITYFILNNEKKLSNNIKTIILLSFMWGIGYIGMWVGKLVLGSILLNDNLFSSALERFSTRVSLETTNGSFTIFEVLKRNIYRYVNKPYFLLLLFIIGYTIFKTKFKIKRETCISIIPFIIISIMPFAWYIVTSNHSYIHCWFTYRTLIITIFSTLCIFTNLIYKNKEK